MPNEDSKLSDHDLLLKLLWTVDQIKVDLANDRASVIARGAVIEMQLNEIKKAHDELCSEVESLRMWKVQVVAYGTAISFFISVITKMFWK